MNVWAVISNHVHILFEQRPGDELNRCVVY
jgi:REP element-mobilizing transposase RayT